MYAGAGCAVVFRNPRGSSGYGEAWARAIRDGGSGDPGDPGPEWGSSDFGWDAKGHVGSFLHEDVDAYLRLSPATYAQSIHTPLLILHSENDMAAPSSRASTSS